jgi:hypothetical protein
VALGVGAIVVSVTGVVARDAVDDLHCVLDPLGTIRVTGPRTSGTGAAAAGQIEHQVVFERTVVLVLVLVLVLVGDNVLGRWRSNSSVVVSRGTIDGGRIMAIMRHHCPRPRATTHELVRPASRRANDGLHGRFGLLLLLLRKRERERCLCMISW